jgi:hypothetical protein
LPAKSILQVPVPFLARRLYIAYEQLPEGRFSKQFSRAGYAYQFPKTRFDEQFAKPKSSEK